MNEGFPSHFWQEEDKSFLPIGEIQMTDDIYLSDLNDKQLLKIISVSMATLLKFALENEFNPIAISAHQQIKLEAESRGESYNEEKIIIWRKKPLPGEKKPCMS